MDKFFPFFLFLFPAVNSFMVQTVFAESRPLTGYCTDQVGLPEVSTQEFARLREQAEQGDSDAMLPGHSLSPGLGDKGGPGDGVEIVSAGSIGRQR